MYDYLIFVMTQHRSSYYRNSHRHNAVAALNNAASSDRPLRQSSNNNSFARQQQRRSNTKRYNQQTAYRSAQPMLSDAAIANYRTMDSSHHLLQQQQRDIESDQKQGFLAKCLSVCGLCPCF
jgi:casein kinase 1